jgi:hypothetical protein
MSNPSPNPLDLAKQGDVQAIAFLINRSLKSKAITAKTALKDGCLQVMLEATQVPDKQTLAPFILKGVKGLGAASIYKLKVYGRQSGETNLAWSQEFKLSEQTESPASQRIREQPKQTNEKQPTSLNKSVIQGEGEKISLNDEPDSVKTASVGQSCLGCITFIFLIMGGVYIFGLFTGGNQSSTPNSASNKPAVENLSPEKEQNQQEIIDDLTLKVATWNAELAAYKAMIRGNKINADDKQLIQLAGLAMNDVLAKESKAVREQAVENATIEFIKTIKIAQTGDAEATEQRIRSRFRQAVKEYGMFITQTLD